MRNSLVDNANSAMEDIEEIVKLLAKFITTDMTKEELKVELKRYVGNGECDETNNTRPDTGRV